MEQDTYNVIFQTKYILTLEHSLEDIANALEIAMSDLKEIAKKYHEAKQKEIGLAVMEERNRLLAALLSDDMVDCVARHMWFIEYPNGLIPPETAAKYKEKAKAALIAAAAKLRGEG